MKSARIICCELDSTLRPTSERGFDIIMAQPELISDPKETEGENTDIFNFCFFSSFHVARQPF